MTTILFVHGTGVRNREEYDQTLEKIRQQVGKRRSDIQVEDCFWGDEYGARLGFNGASIPQYDTTLSSLPGAEGWLKEEQEIALWALLYQDPWTELRLLALLGEKNPSLLGKAGSALDKQIQGLERSDTLNEALEKDGVEGLFADTIQQLRASAPYKDVREQVTTANKPTYCRAIARALVALLIQQADQQALDVALLRDGRLRDSLVQQIAEKLGADVLGVAAQVGRVVRQALLQTAWHVGAIGWVERRRGRFTDQAVPPLGDVLHYLARSTPIRSFIQARIRTVAEQDDKVVLLAHSLGGIICVDLLVKPEQPLSEVKLLVTVGSQAPFLYELDALQSLPRGEPLPNADSFPEWLNIYDLHDFTAYIGEKIFPGRVKDKEVDSRQPFPLSHSAYWDLDEMWETILERLP